jgi:hypothetical protein
MPSIDDLFKGRHFDREIIICCSLYLILQAGPFFGGGRFAADVYKFLFDP